MKSTSVRDVSRSLLASLTSALLVASSCRGGEEAESSASDDAVEFRAAPTPAQIEAEVDTLRGQALVLAPSTPVGTLPGSASVDASGQANYVIPLQLAPGVSRLSPELAISYDSGRGNGILGVGFGLSGQSSIQRCTATIIDDGAWEPVEWTSSDPLCLDGDRLVLESGTYGMDGSRYRLHHDPSRRAVLHGDISVHTSWFEVFHGEGQIDTYGTGVAALWRGQETAYAPYVWGLAQQRDRYDNAIDYVYSHPVLLDSGPAQMRLDEIRYAGTGALATQRRVIFEYEERDDVLDTWFYGAHQRIETRLSTITVMAQNVLQHTYRFAYASGLGGRSELQSVELCDRADACLPPTTFAWEPAPEIDWARENVLQGSSDYFLNELGSEEIQQLLLQSTHTLMLDLDGDLDQEMLFARDAGNIEPWRVWNPEREPDDDVIHELSAPIPPGVTASLDETIATDLLLPFVSSADVLATHLPRFQPPISASVINFGGHRMDDVLLPRRPNPWDETVTDDWGHPYANGIRVGIGHGIDDVEMVDVPTGSTDPIYTMLPIDHDGDHASDIWMCRGPGYKSGHWILARNTGASPYGYTFHDTNVGCSVHDELEVVPTRGGGQRLLVVPAYETDVSIMPLPEDFATASEYVLDYPAIPDDERETYLELRYDLGTATGFLQNTTLPRDRYQRWHDAKCRNGLADAIVGSPILSAGLGQDKLLDLNEDGFVDVLRFELEAGDTLADQEEIAAGLPTTWAGDPQERSDAWREPHQCDASIADHQDAGIRVYWNTGDGFTQGDVVHEFAGIAHANYWVNFVGAQPLDVDDDGRTDLLLPSPGEGDDEWTLLRSRGDGTFSVEDAGNTSGWPAYNDDASWEDVLERSQQSRLLSMQDDAGQRPLLVFIGLVPEEVDPEHNWIGVINAWEVGDSSSAIGRVTDIQDGLGKSSKFEYDVVLAEDNLADPSGHRIPLKAAPLVVSKWTEQTRSEPDVGTEQVPGTTLITTYQYSDPLVDRWGRGLLGFETIDTDTDDGEHRRTRYSLVYDEVVGDYASAGQRIEDIVWHVVDDPADPEQMLVHVERLNWTWTTLPTPLMGGQTLATWAGTVRSRSYGTTDATCDGVLTKCADVIDSLTAYRDGTITETRDAFGTVTSLVTNTWLGEDRTWTAMNVAHDTTNWLLGRVGKTTDRSCSDGGNCKTRTTTFAYSPNIADLEQIVQEPDDPALELTTDFTPDAHGNVETITQTPAAGAPRWSSTEWDDAGVHPLSHTNSLDQTAYVIHDPPSGALLAEVDVAGTTIRYGYDGFLREVSQARHSTPLGPGDGAVLTTEYMSPDPARTESRMRVRTQVTSGQQVTAHVDATGRTIERVWWGMLPVGNTPPQTIGHGDEVYQLYTHDLRGRQYGVSVPQWVGQPTPGWTKTEYDALGRHVRTTAPDGTVVATTRTHYGAGVAGSTIETVTDADGHATRKSYDAQGVLVESVDAANTATCYTPGAFGQILQVRRNCSAQPGPAPFTNMTYDVLGHLATEQESSFNVRRLYWNAFGELDHAINGNDQTTTWFRDQLGRVINVVHLGGVSTFTWDTQRPGALTSSQAPSGTVDSYEYDDFGRTERAHKTVQSSSGVDDYVVEYVWGIGDRLDQIDYPAVDGEPGLSVAYKYDEAGHLREAYEPGGGAVHWLAREANARTQITLERYANGVTTTRGWSELRGWLDTISTLGSAGALQDLTYMWTSAGELDKRIAGPAAGNQEESFVYDPLHRLTTATVKKGTSTPQARLTAYDRVGNITSKTGVGAYGYNAAGRLQTINGGVVSHDNDGNVTAEGGRSFGYTPFGKVSSATKSGVTTTFVYDADQERVRRTHPTEGDTVSIDNLYERELAPIGTTKRITYRVVANGRVVTEIMRTPGAPWNTSVYAVHDDHLGSTNVVSKSTAKREWGVGYDAWGRARSADDWRTFSDTTLFDIGVGFTGHRAKLDLGMIDMRGRTYDPQLGRFLQADPIVSDASDGQSWNRYSYVGNRPLVFTDPTGWRPYAHDDGGHFPHDFHGEGGGLGRWIRVGTSSTSDPDSLFMGGYLGDYDAVPYRDPGFESWGLGPDSDVGGTLSNTRMSPAFYRANAWSLNYLWRSHAEARDAAAAAAMRVRNDRANPFAGLLTISRGLDIATEATLHYGSMVNPVIAAIDTGIRAGDAIAAGDEEELIGIAVGAAVGRLLGGPKALGGAAPGPTVIGKMKDIQNLGPGENTLLKHLQPDLGSPRANWARNSGVLRREMGKGRPIRDASVDATGKLVDYPGSFLNAERNLLRDRGWTYDPAKTLWSPP